MVSAPLPAGDTCDMYALHSTATGHTGTSAYVGVGTSFAAVLPPPTGTTTKTRNPYDVSAYDGMSFNIKSSSGTAPPIWVEFQNTENVPTPDGTAKYSGVDQYNTRGMLLTTVGTSWTNVKVPFGILAPRYLPNLTESDRRTPLSSARLRLGFKDNSASSSASIPSSPSSPSPPAPA